MTQNIKNMRLSVSKLHTLNVTVSGNPTGKPVIICHGGPGGGSSPDMHSYHDAEKYLIIVFDQRGCGASTPFAELRGNTTWNLVEDMEAIRRHLNVDIWQVFGGSWGATLALAYAQRYPEQVSEIILRGVFLCGPQELDWLYQGGASALFPDAWDDFVAPIPPAERGDMITAYHHRLIGEDEVIAEHCAKAWSLWEGRLSTLLPNKDLVDEFTETESALALARIETHYFMNNGFFNDKNALMKNMSKIAHIPTSIVQGRYDIVTPMKTAWRVHKALPKSDLVIVDDAGHSAKEPGIKGALIAAAKRFESLPL